jgi:hypothetical protein
MNTLLKPIGFIKKDDKVIFTYHHNEIIDYLKLYHTDNDDLMKFYKDNWENNSNIFILFDLNN